MIYKRFQYFTKNGIEWTSWFRFSDGNETELKALKKSAKYQLGRKLLNQYKIV